MKKLMSIVIMLAMLMTLFTASPVNAAESVKVDLKQAIEIAKETFNIDSKDYEFTSSFSETKEGQKMWMLNWNAKAPSGKGINVTVDGDTGEILNMSSWESSTQPIPKIAKYSREEALKAAQDLARKLQPEKFGQTKLYENPQEKMYYNYYSDTYNFQFMRLVNGIGFQDNGITVNVDKNTLKVRYFAVNWDKAAVPDSSKAISKEQAKEIFEEKLGIELAYYLINPQTKDGKQTPILVYTLKNSNKPIDAITGELLSNYYGGPMYDTKAMGAGMAATEAAAIQLTPQEQKAVDDISKYITKEKALEVIKKYVNVPAEYVLDGAQLYTGYMGENAAWNINWHKSVKDPSVFGYVNAAVDAVTGELKYFYTSNSDLEYKKDETLKYTKEQCRAIAEAFIKKLQPEKFADTEYRELSNEYDMSIDKPVSYNFNYIRKINGISAPFNNINVTVSTKTGEVMGYNMAWTDLQYPDAQGTISLEEAYKILYSKSDLALKYIKQYDYRKYGDTPATKLAYVLDDLTGMIDAKTGKLIDYNGQPIIEANDVAFTDIKGHKYEKDIELLIEMKVIESQESEFKPDSQVLQKDFVKMLMKSVQPNYYIPLSLDSSTNYDYYYDQAVQMRILTAKDKNPDAAVSRQDAAKMLVKALGVGFVADLSNIYTLTFKDADQVAPGYKGYVAIASELGIAKAEDGNFNPARNITRGETAAMLVSLMKTDTTPKDSMTIQAVPAPLK